MSMTQFSSDVEAVARDASTYCDAIVAHSVAAAEFNHFQMAKTIKYNLNRLKELRLITEEEQSQLNQLADQVGTNSDLSALAQAVQRKENVSPLAVALAGLAVTSSPGTAAASLAGGVIGALIGFFPFRDPIVSEDVNAPTRALACILSAVGGAAAGSTSEIIKARTQNSAST
jgi:hypothetical protein